MRTHSRSRRTRFPCGKCTGTAAALAQLRASGRGSLPDDDPWRRVLPLKPEGAMRRECWSSRRAQPVTAPPWLFFIVPSGSELSSGEGRCPKRGQRLAVRVSPSISSVSFSAGV